MELFFNLGITGVCFIIIGISILKCNKCEVKNIEDSKPENTYMDYMDSEVIAKIHFKYGILLAITGAVGFLFYETMGLVMVFVMVLVLSSYLIQLAVNMYKYLKLAK